MNKFAISITQDKKKIVKTFENKEEAMEFGAELAAKTPSTEGLVSCISADFDAEGNMIGNKYRLYHSWF